MTISTPFHLITNIQSSPMCAQSLGPSLRPCVSVPQSFIQDLLCGRGAAQGLYQWMTAPPESQLTVLHATSLATQGQGWGSYQSLSSVGSTFAGHGDHENASTGRRRRRSRELSAELDAATRSLVAVMIKTNGLLAEAVTFAK